MLTFKNKIYFLTCKMMYNFSYLHNDRENPHLPIIREVVNKKNSTFKGTGPQAPTPPPSTLLGDKKEK